MPETPVPSAATEASLEHGDFARWRYGGAATAHIVQTIGENGMVTMACGRRFVATALIHTDDRRPCHRCSESM